MRPDVLKLGFRLKHRRNMTGRNPPERLMCLSQLVEPGIPITDEFYMRGLVGIGLQGVHVFPDTHIHQEHGVIERSDAGRISAVADEAPNETRNLLNLQQGD